MSTDSIQDVFSHGGYEFKKAAGADLPRIQKWLDAKHLSDWWVPSGEELGAALAVSEGRGAWLVSHDGLVFAYIQLADAAFDPVIGEQAGILPGTVRFDQFVGDAEMIGFGHGVKFIKAFVAAMREQKAMQKLVAAPSKDNVFAVRSYSQAGFRAETILETPHGNFTLMGLAIG